MGSEAQANSISINPALVQMEEAAIKEAVRRQDLAEKAKAREMHEFSRWWQSTSADDLSHYLQKAIAYGSLDLEIMGAAELARGNAVGGPAGQIAAIMFYALGKVARAQSALKAGDLPSQDTLDDLVIYGNMARYILKHGGLPDVR